MFKKKGVAGKRQVRTGQATVVCESEILWIATTGRGFSHFTHHSQGWAGTHEEDLVREKVNFGLGATDGRNDGQECCLSAYVKY